jgi:hypothetical protein
MYALRNESVAQGSLRLPGSTLQDVFPHLMGADIGGIDVAHRVSRNTGC